MLPTLLPNQIGLLTEKEVLPGLPMGRKEQTLLGREHCALLVIE